MPISMMSCAFPGPRFWQICASPNRKDCDLSGGLSILNHSDLFILTQGWESDHLHPVAGRHGQVGRHQNGIIPFIPWEETE